MRRAVIHLGGASPRRSSGLPGSGASHAIASLFGLAPDGVCRAAAVTGGAVGFYPAVSPLPELTFRRARSPEMDLRRLAAAQSEPSAVCFLLHFPSSRDARPLADILRYGARTFLRATRARRLPGELPGENYSGKVSRERTALDANVCPNSAGAVGSKATTSGFYSHQRLPPGLLRPPPALPAA